MRQCRYREPDVTLYAKREFVVRFLETVFSNLLLLFFDELDAILFHHMARGIFCLVRKGT